jgi:hypothetical protein
MLSFVDWLRLAVTLLLHDLNKLNLVHARNMWHRLVVEYSTQCWTCESNLTTIKTISSALQWFIRFKSTVALIENEKILLIAKYNFDILHASKNLLMIFNRQTVVDTTSRTISTDTREMLATVQFESMYHICFASIDHAFQTFLWLSVKNSKIRTQEDFSLQNSTTPHWEWNSIKIGQAAPFE